MSSAWIPNSAPNTGSSSSSGEPDVKLQMRDIVNGVGRCGLRAILVIVMYTAIDAPMRAQPGGPAPGRKDVVSSPSASHAQRSLQGSSVRVWFSNEMTFGRTTFNALPPPDRGYFFDATLGMGVGRDDSVEHLFGAGPWIGGLINGVPRVLTAYNSDGIKDFPVDPLHPLKNRIHSSLTWNDWDVKSRRACDDDGDGLIDEDPLDGRDNDGDWDPVWHDVGSDGIPDINEYGCKGAYNAGENPDPAFDNFAPTEADSCRPDSTGLFPLRSDPYQYTERNGMSDSGEPYVDEDYGRISDFDQVCEAENRSLSQGSPAFNVVISQRNLTWFGYPQFQSGWSDGFTPVEFRFVNMGVTTARDVYLGFFADMDVGHIGRPGYFFRNYSCYIESLRTAYTHDPWDPAATPAGITVLGASGNPDSMITLFHQWTFAGPPWNQADHYTVLSGQTGSPTMTQCQPLSDLSDTRFLLSVGPYAEFKPGDTLTIIVAFVGGEGIYGKNSLAENAAKAIVLYERDQHQPVVPAAPNVTVEQGNRKIHLRWNMKEGYDGPVSPWDLYNTTLRDLPDDHWRKLDPPCTEIGEGFDCPEASHCLTGGAIPGARNFEGFRLYRGEGAPGAINSWFSMIREFDVVDEYGFNFGIDSAYTDDNLIPGNIYFYGVTSFGVPEVVVRRRLSRSGMMVVDTLVVDGPESRWNPSLATPLELKYSASDEPGMVKVVPNPYRAYEDYSREAGGWEGSARSWTEFDRVLKFIHLPRSCTIRICSLAGDIVKTLRYEAPASNPNEGELDWDLISEGGWSVASGVYVYIVDSPLGTQYGKFVVIR